ncbi:zinc finger AZF2-like [Olea europaea subsp. europaea]|uniref:Zinc finger AZF2-like n=1 Tax=Olea europaea subsp. europaea TaxID=158383 RepID=A0A8S0S3H3_OLEEU|nr:zinc finger AZF2-like [Olea europaea subsp. europaea]
MAGLQTSEFDTLCSQSSKKINHEPTEIEEEAALVLLMLSQDNRSWHTSPSTRAVTVIELIEDVLNPATNAVATTRERTAALASAGDDKKSMEPFSPTIIASPLDRNMPYICSLCRESFSSYQALGGHKTSHPLGGHMRKHYEGVIKGGKKTGVITYSHPRAATPANVTAMGAPVLSTST